MKEIMSLNRDDRIWQQLHEQPEPVGGRYAPVAGTFVRCAGCSRDFRSTLTFKTLHDFERAATVGFVAQCPNCYAIFECNRRNMYCELAARDHSAVSEVVPMAARRRLE
ncbi:MAG TPA: hypothetical protein VI319_03500 [Burkholderiales bacterium]